MRYFLACLFITTSALSQPIQEFKVRSFAGGMVNSLSNALMQDDQALVLENYDIINGKLKRRPGYTLYKSDVATPLPIFGLFPYQAQTDKDFLTLRTMTSFYADDTADKYIGLLTQCSERQGVCTTLVAHGFLTDRRNQNVPYNINVQTINNRLVLAVAKSEMQLYDGVKAFPARPRMTGQPKAVPLDGGWHMNGIFSYRFLFVRNNGANDRYSNLGPPSWPVEVKDGKIMVLDLGPVITESLQDSIKVYRKKNDESYQYLTTITLPDVVDAYYTYLDTFKTTSAADTLPYPWGYRTNCIEGGCVGDSVPSPSGMLISSDFSATAFYGVSYKLKGLTDTTCLSFAYSVVFRDSSGRESYASAPACESYSEATIRAAGGDKWRNILTKIPVPRDSGIVDKILMRQLCGTISYKDSLSVQIARYTPKIITNVSRVYRIEINGRAVAWRSPAAGANEAMIADSLTKYINLDSVVSKIVTAFDTSNSALYLESALAGNAWTMTGSPYMQSFNETIIQKAFGSAAYIYNFVPIDTLGATVTSYTDSIPYDSLPVIQPWCDDSSSAQEPTDFCYDDSNITFQPFDIAYHGDRLFAIGEVSDRNALWYSEFGHPTTFPIDHFLNVESQKGDWFNRLLSVGDNLLLFRQNSIYGLSGLSFFQFNLEKLVAGVGLSAPRSLTANKNIINFLHESGAYEMSTGGGLSHPPISWVIKNSIDSVGTNLRRGIGKAVGDDWWLSLPVSGNAADSVRNNQTYIYSRTPTPHWKTYSFGINDIVLYDKDTLALDYATDKFIFASGTDSLFQWGDVTASTDNGALIQCKYRSKYFFHEGEAPIRREKIFYVDFFGKHIGGLTDTLMVTFYEESKGAVDSVKFQPNFSDRKVDRVFFNRISDNCSIGWRAYGLAVDEISGFTIGFLPWDDGMKR